MKLVVFGSTGGTGRRIVEQALARGHRVTAFARNPAALGIRHDALSVVQGDALDALAVARAVAGHEAVLSALGVTRHTPMTICSDGTRHIVAAMKRHELTRLVCESAYGAGSTRNRGPYAWLLGLAIRARLADKERMEALVAQSGLDWVIVRPSILTAGPHTGRYRAGVDLALGWAPRISRADVADFMLAQLTSERWWRKSVAVTG